MRFIFFYKIFSEIHYLGVKNRRQDVEIDNSNNKLIVILLINEKVDTLENYNEIIHAVSLSLQVPSVVKLKYYAKII